MKKMAMASVRRYINNVNMLGGAVFVEEADDEDLTALPRDDAEPIQLDASIAVDEVYMQLDGNMFIDDSLNNEEHDTNANDKEEISSKDGYRLLT
jgi:hypothetical protein